MAKSGTKEHDKKCAGRPRDVRCTERVRHAALELGTDTGFDGLTMEGVAARAGVGKATIYRRWPNVWAIVVDALLEQAAKSAPILQRSTARKSLTASMRLVAKAFRGKQGRILRALIGRAQMDPSLRKEIGEHWLHSRRQLSREIIRKGIATGELRPGLDPDTVLDALYGALYHRLLLPYDGDEIRLSDAYIDALVDVVFGGIERKKET
jgi:AcrR family transcriptional regulator